MSSIPNASPIQALRDSDGQVSLYFTRLERPNEDKRPTLTLSLRDVRGLGTYALNQAVSPLRPPTNPPFGSYTFRVPTTNPREAVRDYLTGPTATGQVLITRLDTVAQIISGTFEFTAQEATGTGTVRVTQGRFDLPYYHL